MQLGPRVVIVGAGPAGIAAAITLNRAGAVAVVIDKAGFPRDKCCGDGLTTGALRQLEQLGLVPETVASFTPVQNVWLHAPNGQDRHFPLPTGAGTFAATATRLDLDSALVDLAVSTGVDIRQRTSFSNIEVYDDSVVLQTDCGPIVADYCIAADGMWSSTRKALGLGTPGYLGEWHAFRQYWRNVAPAAASDLHVWFEPDILPGYVWSFPLPDGRANIGFGVLRSANEVGSMKKIWPAILDRPHIRAIIGADAEPESPHRAWPIPARVGKLPLTSHRTFFVGDAAAACDPLTGEGIGQALQTGVSAAKALLAHDEPAAAAAAYERSVYEHLTVDMQFADRLSTMLGNRTSANAALATAGASAWTRRNFARWLFEDYPRAILGTPKRWARDLFTQPGAYR